MRPFQAIRPARLTAAVLAALGAGVLLAGCAGSATPAASSSQPPTSAPAAPETSAPETSAPETSEPAPDGTSELVTGVVWVSSEVKGQELVPGSTITITQLEDRLSVNAGCNTINGSFTDNGDSWAVGPLMSTMMGCDEALMAQDAWLTTFLEAGPTAIRDDAGLTLAAGDITITFTERMAPSITDTPWELTGLISTDAISSVPIDAEGAVMTIVDGTLELTGLCNGIGGTVVIEGDTLTIEQGPATMMSCGDVDAAEQHARGVLSGESTFVISDQSLVITKDGNGLQFTAVSIETGESGGAVESVPAGSEAVGTFPESPATAEG